jgi:photosystem II stability/assembly factor-like uncharacterized protein
MILVTNFFILTDSILAQWTQTNLPCGGMIRCLASDGTNVYAVTSSWPYLSTNNGNSWYLVNKGLPEGTLSSIVINGSMVFCAAGQNGVYLSTNKGENWSAVNSGLADKIVISLATKDNLILAGTYNGILFSTDNGSNWIPTDVPLPDNNLVRALAIGVEKIFAATEGSDGSLNAYSSADTGKNWTNLNLGTRGNMYCIVIQGLNVYIGTSAGIFISPDNGVTWTKSYLGINSLSIYDSLIIATNGMGIFKSTDNGSWWMKDTSAVTVNAMETCSAANGSTFFVGTSNSLLRSTDYGVTWTLANTGLSDINITCLAESNGSLFAGVWGGGIYTSSDNGESWTHNYLSLNWAADITSLAVSPIIAETGHPDIYAGTAGFGGIHMSSDNGQNWSEMSNGVNQWVEAVAVQVAPNSFSVFAGTSFGTFVSVDSGKSWAACGLQDTVILSLAVNDSCLFAGTSQVSYANGPPSYRNPGGVFSSTNSGVSWRPAGLAHHEISSLSFYDGNLIAKTLDEGFFVSSDGGETWTHLISIATNIQNATIHCIAATNKNIFAGTNGKGVWKRPIMDMITEVTIKSIQFPAHYSLQQNYPNPFNPSTIIDYQLPANSHVTLILYDILGRKVETLVDERQSVGSYSVKLNASDLSSGVYFYRLEAGTYHDTKKLLLLK